MRYTATINGKTVEAEPVNFGAYFTSDKPGWDCGYVDVRIKYPTRGQWSLDDESEKQIMADLGFTNSPEPQT